jgi:hypothetical protein
MSYLGGTTLSWQSDYGQFYLIDSADTQFAAPTDIAVIESAGGAVALPGGLVVYTADCLQQVIEIRLFSAEPPAAASEWRSGKPWTAARTVPVRFPSRQFAVSSPSKTGTEAYGPLFRVEAAAVQVRIQWMEVPGTRYDDKPMLPDVIRLDIWPA